MSQVESPRLRAAYRTRDPAALGALLASQLLAFRCSTVYGPSAALVREVVETHALPQLVQQHEVRSVIVTTWPEGGPSLAHIVAELLRQLGLDPAGEPGEPAGLRQVLARAHRSSERPLVIVLHDLGRLLDDDRDHTADHRLLDALAAAVELPIHGLQLVMTVAEHDLGAFRHLLRGHWRLLANDLRLHSDDRRLPLPVPLPIPGAAAVAVASRGPALAALAGAALGLAGLAFGLLQRGAADTAREQLAACHAAPTITCPEVQPTILAPVPEDSPPPPPIDPPPIDPPPPERPPGDPPPATPDPAPAKAKTCPARPADGPCAQCARSSCCSQLHACKSSKWKTCVLDGKVPGDECPPDEIEKDCRGLALCALEYQCNAVCYNQ